MKYIIRQEGRSVEVSMANSSILVYRIPYQNLLDSTTEIPIKIKNPFIVYILYRENPTGKDAVYVGKSKNGLKNRPTSHGNNWNYCYILTQFEERTFFNDGTIQYIEDKISKKVKETGHYENITQITNENTVNRYDEEDCDAYLEKVYDMLDILGLDLITFQESDDQDADDSAEDDANVSAVPDGIYHMSRKLKRWGGKIAEGKMQVSGDKFIVLPGSKICPNEGPRLFDSMRIRRQSANVVDDVLQDPEVFWSPSMAAAFIIGGHANGWNTWRTDNDEFIDVFRQNQE